MSRAWTLEQRKVLSEKMKRNSLCSGCRFKHTEEAKKKIKKAWTPERRKALSEKMKGNIFSKGVKRSVEWKKKMSKKLSGANHPWFGRKHTAEWKKKVSGVNHHSYGKKWPEEAKRKLSLAHKGHPVSEVTKLKISLANKGRRHTGESNPGWKGGLTPLCRRIRVLSESKNWIRGVFERDNYMCQRCGQKGGRLNAHHKVEFKKIFHIFLKEYSQFSPVEDKETLVRLATKYEPFWDIDNGKTLCIDCHRKKK